MKQLLLIELLLLALVCLHESFLDDTMSNGAATLRSSNLKAKVDLLLPDGMIKLENDIQVAAQHVEGVKTAAKDHMDGFRFRDESDKQTLRKDYLAERHQIAKYQGYMTTQNFPKGLAKYAGTCVRNFGFFSGDPL